MRALIIEDEPLISWMIEDLLVEQGYDEIDIACSEPEAVAAAERASPYLIVSDANLLRGSGVSAVRVICAERYIPTVFLTGDPESVIASLPAAIVLEKPLGTKDFISAIELAIVGARQAASDAPGSAPHKYEG